MRTLRIVVFVSVVCLALMPFTITRSRAERAAGAKARIPNIAKGTTVVATQAPATQSQRQQVVTLGGPAVNAGPISPEMVSRLGLGPQQQQTSAQNQSKAPGIGPESAGLPTNMNASAPFSAAIATTVAKGFLEADTMGDWDGKEDDTADHGGKIMDSTNVPPAVSADPNFFLTRVAFSEHTIANGFATLGVGEDIFYSGDSIGNVYVASTSNLTLATPAPNIFTINLPATLTSLGFGPLTPANKIVVTGMAVSPVCDLGAFSAAFPAYVADFPAGTIGEIIYVSFTDTGSTFLVAATPARSGVLAIPISDAVNAGAPAPPGRISPASYPVTVGGPVAVIMSTFSNLAGCAVDDDGNLYFQQVDLVGLSGGSIIKVSSLDTPTNQDRALITLPTALSASLTASGTATGPATQVNRFTTYAGPSTFFGNVVSLATGQGNLVYAAVARSLNPADSPADQATEGPFQNPGGLGATPSMVITLADASGSFDNCSAPNPGTAPACPACPASTKVGLIPAGDGIADVVPGTSISWTAFVLGNGPDRRAASGTDALIFGTPTNTLKLDMGIDHSIYSGITVNEEGTVYVISGGTPAGVGTNPSGNRGEVLSLEDNRPGDRRADYIDFRGDNPPNPPASGGNVGDGDSDRFDHIFYQAPIDLGTLAPAGLAGLSRGFLRYTNRLAPTGMGPGGVNEVTLGVTDRVLGDDDTTHDAGVNQPIVFEKLDPSHQVAGGDDQVSPFTGDDDNGAGNPVTAGPLSGGFEFLFANPLGDVFQVGAACGTGNGVWNGFFLNSNGNITFGGGDTDFSPTVTELRHNLPRIAPAWTDLDPSARAISLGDFPVQAVGFANINAFKIRYINVPHFGDEDCATANPTGSGLTNTFSVTLYDDGTGVDENANQPLNPANPIGNNAVPFDLLEGPTALRFQKVSTGAGTVFVGEPPRLDGMGIHTFNYGRMDLLGDGASPVVTGFSIGNQNPTNPPGFCELDLANAAVSADTGFGNIQGQAETRWPTVIGDGTEAEIHEFFHNGVRATIDPGTGVFTLAQPDFDLRFEGNGNATPANQIVPTDVNRDKVGLYGTTCQLPSNPQILTVTANPFVTTPTTAANSLINAYAPVTINLLGTGFFANEVTTLCPSSTGDLANPEITVPIARPGKTVSTAAIVSFDTNGDGIPDLPVSLTSVTPVSRNLVTATAAPLPNASGQGPGSPWPFLAPGGVPTVTLTTTFGKGDNNIFNLLVNGGFTRSATLASIDSGARAPVVVGSSPTVGDVGAIQNLTITGWNFQYTAGTNIPAQVPVSFAPRPFTVNGVFAVQRDNPANVIQATSFNVLSNNTVSANFNFAGSPVGRQFLIFVTNAAGTSRNALTAPGGASPNGNEQGGLVLFTVNDTVPPTITCPANVTVNVPSGQLSAAVTYPAPVVTDDQPGATVSCNPASGSTFNLGTTVVTCTATDTSGNSSSCSFNVGVFQPNSMHLSSSNYNVTEGCVSALITVQRENPSGTASVDFATSDGSAVQKSDYGITLTTVNFNAGETSKTVSVIVNDDGFVEGPETVNLTLSNPQGGLLVGPALGTLTITDNDLVPPVGNINDDPGAFVCQQYHDFLNRDSDAPGAAFWTSQITSCGVDPACIELKRINVSGAFFLSIEFQETGGDVLRVQRTAFGRRSDNPLLRVPYQQFMRDAQQVGRGVVVGQAGFQVVLDANKAAYVTQIVSSSAFITQFPLSQTAATYVDTLFASAGVAPTAAERNAAITAFGAGGTAGRAAALQSIADSNSVRQADINGSFVLLEYFGYLRRNPTDPPDNNDVGYQFWLTKLNSFGGNFVNAEMVKAFIQSSEYRQRFGP